MMGRTHALLGVSSLWILTLLPVEASGVNMGMLAVCAAFGALCPDLDAADSTLKHITVVGVKPFVLPTAVIHQFGHRGLLHSLLGLGLFSMMTLPLLVGGHWLVWLALVLGYSSHLLGDSCTRSGILFFYPRTTRYYLLPKTWRLATGSMAEEALFPLLATAVVALLLLRFTFANGGTRLWGT